MGSEADHFSEADHSSEVEPPGRTFYLGGNQPDSAVLTWLLFLGVQSSGSLGEADKLELTIPDRMFNILTGAIKLKPLQGPENDGRLKIHVCAGK